MPSALFLPFIFFLSGTAALVFEMVWFYRCGLVFGSTVWAASLTLSSFMGGLAIGNGLVGLLADRIRRPLLLYAAAEFAVGLAGVAVVYGLSTRALAFPLTRLSLDSFWAVNVLRFATVFATLLVPATAMGTTLPLLTSALCRERVRFGPALGRLYGWNTLGAVCGALVAELVLVRRFGVTGSAWLAALLACAVGVAALAVARREATSDAYAAWEPRARSSARASRLPPAMPQPRPPLAPLAAAGLAGANLLVLEVVWLRFLSMFVLTTTLAMSVMLAVVLAAIGSGALVGARWLAGHSSAVADVPAVALGAGCAVVVSYAGFDALTSGTQVGDWQQMVWFAGVLTSPTAFMSGVLFTLLGDRLSRDVGSAERAAAWLALANTVGATFGPLLATFLLLPALGMERTFFAVAASYVVIAAMLLTLDRIALAARIAPAIPTARTSATASAAGTAVSARSGFAARKATVAAALACLAALAAFPFGTMHRVYFTRAAAPYAGDGSTIVATREGTSETIFVMRQTWMGQPVYDRLVTNGFSMSGTAVPALRYMRDFVYLPMLLRASPLRRVLVICYGVGVTAAAATDIPWVQSIDVVELSRDIVAMSDVIYTPDRHPLRDPRIRLHIEDGRSFLEASEDRFDLITGEPPPPRTPGAVNIYTREYFRLMHDRLTEGGMATYWLPVARPHPGTDVNTIVRAFCDTFDDCSLWNATPFDLMLVGTRHSDGPVALASVRQAWAIEPLAGKLREIGFDRPEQVGATFLGDAAFVRQLAADAPPLTDDFPQRLRPDAFRRSLSDPRDFADAAVRTLYERVTDPRRAREAFERSAFVQRVFPPGLRADTAPFFEVQPLVNRVLLEGGNPLRRIEDLDAVLTRTSLQTLALWMLGTDDVKQRIARARDDQTGSAQYARALDRLAARDYLGAATGFAAAEQRGFRGATLRPLLVYALCRGGNSAGAGRLARGVTPHGAEETHFWSWMRTAFGVGP